MENKEQILKNLTGKNEEAAQKAGLEYEIATVSDSNMIQQVTESLIGKVDAIYIPTDNLLAEGMSTVAQVANANNLPCIVGEEGMTENGGLGTYGIDYYELGRLTSVQASKILSGQSSPANMPIEYMKNPVLSINTNAAQELGVLIPAGL